ncbi:hypothetical protein CCR96_02675 [Halochromatium roseum]|nr:hypothetical protein [Halochromatium roseum]
MSNVRWLLNRTRKNPRDWRIQEVKTVANGFGIDYRQPGTSHVTSSTRGCVPVTIPAHKPIAPIDIKRLCRLG